jgi:mannose-6-phosphate isomerase-like protein (cupin superfamily)
MTTPGSDSVFEAFAVAARAEGFDEVLRRDWGPGVVLDTHTHAFAVKAVVTRGEMWLTLRGATRHLREGDAFEVELAEPHAERYGADGASYLVARRNPGKQP